ncbi:MAG: repair protein RecO [Thermosediminibacterales bacterium]|nr:repair protein RecO [Thermosediminibacterales bacterium]MDK2835645.1 repair protein RecO [Thermosediminibacterales bacterium]
MSLYKTEAIVLKSNNLGEADKIITLFSSDRGKIRAVARGARRPRNRLAAATQPFCYSDFLIFEGKNLDSISQCQIKESFLKIREDLEKMLYSTYIAELVNEFLPEGEEDKAVFSLVLKTFYSILNNLDIELTTRVFELQFVAMMGYMPNLENCSICGGKLTEFMIYFSPEAGGALCSKCVSKIPAPYGDVSITPGCIKIKKATIEVLKSFLRISLTNLRAIKLPKDIKKEMKQTLRIFIDYHLNKKLKSLSLLNKITLNN